MSTLFISHSSRDNAAAKALQTKLAEQGHRSVFLDLDPDAGIQAGVSWERTLYTKLRACRAVVALASDSYLASQWCFAEVALARMEGKDLFVLQIDPWSEGTEMPSILTEEQFIDLRSDPDDGYRRLWNGFKVKGIVPAEQRDWHPDDPPYPGLRAFHEEDAPIFFGRDAEIQEGTELLNQIRRQGYPRMAMVLGSSGSGKSSLVRAGIVPQLKRDARQWHVVAPFRPGRDPIHEVAVSLSAAFDAAGAPRRWQDLYRDMAPDGAPVPEEAEPSDTLSGDGLSAADARNRLLEALEALEGEFSAAGTDVSDSVRNLKSYLDDMAETEALPGTLFSGEMNALARLVLALQHAGPHREATVVLVIDQFEELLGQPPDSPASGFLRMLRDALDHQDSPLLVIGTMRSDFLGLLQASAPLQGMGRKSLSVGPMSQQGMRQIIDEPAKLGQIELEKGLADLLMEDTATADALPLLAFTLRIMWDRYRADRLLAIVEYRELGGLQGAVAMVAEETMQAALDRQPDPATRDAVAREMRDAFLGMARPAAQGAGWSRQPMAWDQIRARVQPLIAPFIDPQRLLVRREDGTVEVAHEALFRSWDRLRGWLDQNAEGLHLLQELSVEAERWQAAPDTSKGEYLWSGGRLVRARELRTGGVLTLDKTGIAFIEASVDAEEAAARAEEARRQRELKRTRTFAGVVGAAFVVACGLGVFAWNQRNEAERQTDIARQQTVIAEEKTAIAQEQTVRAQEQGAIAQARTAISLMDSRPLEGLLNAIEAADPDRIGGTEDRAVHPEVETALIEAVRAGQAGRIERTALTGHPAWVGALAYHPDGSRLVSADDSGTVRIWSVDGSVLATLPEDGERGGPIEELAVGPDPDDSFIVAVGEDGLLLLDWDGNLTESELPLPVFVTPPEDADMIETTETVAHAPARATDGDNGPDGPETDLDADDGGGSDGRAHDEEAPEWTIGENVAVSPDGQKIAAGFEGGIVLIWDRSDLATPPAVIFTDPEDTGEMSIGALAFSPDGSRIATGHEAGVIRTWTLDGAPMQTFEGHIDFVEALAYSPDGRFLLSASDDKTVRRWALQDEASHPVVTEATLFLGHENQVLNLAISRDGTVIASVGEDRTIRLWNIHGAKLAPPLRGHGGPVFDVAFSPDGRTIASASLDLTVRLWDLPMVATSHRESPGVAVSPDGSVIATSGLDDSTVRLFGSDLRPLAGAVPFAGHPMMTGRLAFVAEDEVLSFGGAGLLSSDLSGALARRITDPYPPGRGLAVSADGAHYATGGADGRAIVWTREGEEVLSLTYPDELDSIALGQNSTHGPMVATGDADGVIRVYRLDGTQIAEILDAGDGIYSLAFSSDGTRLLSAGRDRTIRVHDVTALDDESMDQAETTITGHVDVVSAAQFFIDERFIVSAGEDNSVRIWRRDGTPVGRPMVEHGDWVLWLATDEGNRRVYTVDKIGTLRRWDMDYLDDTPLQLLARLCERLARHSIRAKPRAETAHTICTGLSP